MRYQLFLVLAFAFTIAAWAAGRAIGDELPSKDHPSPEPFGDLQPFDLSKRADATNKTDAKKPDAAKAEPQSDTNHALQRNPKVADDILKVNELGDPERIVFEGVKLFREKQLRLALACDLKYQAAARPSNKAGDFLDVLERRLLEGYLNSGCPDAEVRARLDGDRKTVVVLVDEGPRFRKGQILVTGSKVINEEAIRDFLTKPQRACPWVYTLGGKRLDIFAKDANEDKKPTEGDSSSSNNNSDPVTIWEPGKAIDFRRFDNSQLERGIRFALAEVGFAASPFRVELERDAKQGVANLHISILHDVPSAVLADIEVAGLKRDSRKALLHYLKIGPGDTLTGETLWRLDERLSDSCRYWTHKIEVAVPLRSDRYSPQPEASKLKLTLTLEEYEPTPPLGKPLSAVDETLRKCAGWLNSLTRDFGTHDLVVTTAAADLGGLVQHAQLVLAPDGTTALDVQLAAGDWRIDHSAIVGPHGIELYDWKHNDKFCISQKFFPTAQLMVGATHAEDGKQESRMMLGYALGNSEKDSSRGRFPISIQVEPAALLRFAHREDVKAKSHEGRLTLTDDEVELQVDETTGAIRSLKCASFLPAGISAVDFRSEQGLATLTVKKIQHRGNNCHNLCDEKNPLGSAVTYAVQQIERQPSIQSEPKNQAFWQIAGKVSTSDAFRRLTNPETYSMLDADSTTKTFAIPGRPEFTGDNWGEYICYYVPFLVDQTFPRGSWPWTVLREICLGYENVGIDSRKNYAQSCREFDRMSAAREYGPLCGLVTAELWRMIYPSSSKAIARSADEGLRHMSDDAFLRDIRLLTDGNHGLAVLSRSIAETCGKMSCEDQEALLKQLPPEFHDIFEGLIARRKIKPDEPPGDAIRCVMLDEWHKRLKSEVEARLRAIAEASSDLQTAAPATK
jgi:hypothetical protein